VSNAVATLGMAIGDPPTQSEMQTIADKLDERIHAPRRGAIRRRRSCCWNPSLQEEAG
jgi:hypothetical protein